VSGVGTLSLNAPQNMPYPLNTVVWPTSSIPEKGAAAQATAIASTTGGIGYVGTAFVGRAGGYEAFIQNTAGNFEQATLGAIKAAAASGPWVKDTQPNEIPPGYPFVRNGYVPLPSDPNAAALVSYDFGYFYSCSPLRTIDQITQLHGLFKWGLVPQNGGGPTAADQIAEANGLVELPDVSGRTGGASKLTSVQAIFSTGIYRGAHSGFCDYATFAAIGPVRSPHISTFAGARAPNSASIRFPKQPQSTRKSAIPMHVGRAWAVARSLPRGTAGRRTVACGRLTPSTLRSSSAAPPSAPTSSRSWRAVPTKVSRPCSCSEPAVAESRRWWARALCPT
jgi:hypothetical protein